jgi:hypothetical protein
MTDKPEYPVNESSTVAHHDHLPAAQTDVEEIVLYCANHPTVETSLRCSRCEKPICVKCAVSTPTGYKCKECISGQQKVFSTTRWYDYPLAFVIGAVLAAFGAFLVNLIWLILVLLIAPAAGMIIAEAVRAAVRRRRSLRLWQMMAAGIIVGCLPFLLTALLSFSLWSILAQGFYVFTVVTSAVARLRGINIR